ncbi:MAG: DNA topoisomerase IB [Cyanobacteria bacterium J06598_1]
MSATQLYKNAAKSAKLAGLRYVSDQQPGIKRRRWGRGFSYIDVDGTRIQDRKKRSQLKAMAIPPSWKDVWICVEANGHLRATGRDLKQRKQYRYHPDWITLRNQIKFDRLIPFAEALPTLRQTVQAEITQALKHGKKSQPKRSTVIAAVVDLLDETAIRIGNLQYAEANDSYGLTTLKTRHADISTTSIELQFVGKSGVEHDIELKDAQLAKIMKRCEEIPGQTLFQYIDEAGHRQAVDSGDVNEYLQATMGSAFTAKDFRTWQGTVTAANYLYQLTQDSVHALDDSDSVRAIEAAAERLGNRPATCRKYYVHPRVLESYQSQKMVDAIAAHAPQKRQLLKFLDDNEQRTFAVLKAGELSQ